MDRTGGNARALSQHDEKVAFLRRSPADDRLVWGIDAGGDERQQFWTLAPDDAPVALTEAPGGRSMISAPFLRTEATSPTPPTTATSAASMSAAGTSPPGR